MTMEEKERMRGAYGAQKNTTRSTKKNPKVYSDTTPLEEIIKNKTIKHQTVDAISFRKLRKRIK
jgi:hypothetical protein